MQLSVTRPRCCNGERTRPEDLAISGIVAAELWTGVMKSRAPRRNAQALDDFLALVEVLGWPLEGWPQRKCEDAGFLARDSHARGNDRVRTRDTDHCM